MMRVSAGIAAALLSIRVLDGSTGLFQPSRKFNLAVVRADGVLIPFAHYDRGTWRPFWTAVDNGVSRPVPITLDDVDRRWWREEPPALDWFLWRPDRATARLRATAPRVVYTPCATQVGLATNYATTGALPPPHHAPYPKAGLASTAPIHIEPILEVPPSDTDWTRVKRALDEREFRAAELGTLRDMHWTHPVRPVDRDRAPIDLQAVWHVKDSRFFYFEAMRRYPDPKPPKGKPPCELVTYVAGYLWETRSEELQPVGVSALVTYCHMERAAFLWPFGVIRDGGRQFWVFQSAGWTGETYGIREVEPARGTLRWQVGYNAGSCGR